MDIVIPYRRSNSEELKYTLRGLRNLDHGEVYVIGDRTNYRVNNMLYKHTSDIALNTLNILRLAAEHPEVSDNFIWWHDDMMLLKPIKSLPVFHQGEYDELLKNLQRNNYYTAMKNETNNRLKALGIEKPLFYDVHFPFVFNKKKVLKIIDQMHKVNKISFYANYYGIKGERIQKDFKVRNNEDYSDLLISTYDPSFNSSRAGEYIRETLKEPSEYEYSFVVYDDTESGWERRYNRRNRVNGAKSYTNDIVKYQIPIWEKLTKNKSISISTTALISSIKNFHKSAINIQYLHTYIKPNPLEQVKTQSKDTVFIVSYLELHRAIKNAGYKSIFIPMTIDSDALPQKANSLPMMKPNTVVYYGNVTPPKQATFNTLKSFFESKGWTFDYISDGQLNGQGEKLTQEQCWDILKTYNYGIGVGRCYMEMSAMGLKCIVAGNNIGGITTTKTHHKKQVDTNYNTNIVTYSDDLEKIFKNMDRIKPQFEDIRDNIDLIEERIKEAL